VSHGGQRCAAELDIHRVNWLTSGHGDSGHQPSFEAVAGPMGLTDRRVAPLYVSTGHGLGTDTV